MSDSTDNTETQEQATEVSTPSQAQNSDIMIPKPRFDEINNRYKELQAQLEQLKGERQRQQEQELEEQNKWRELAEQRQAQLEELEAIKSQAERYQQSLQATNDARIQRIPEERQSLIPEYEDPVKLSAWLDQNEALLQETPKPKAPGLDGGSGSGGSSKGDTLPANTEGIADLARQYGLPINRDRLAERIRSPQKPTDIGE